MALARACRKGWEHFVGGQAGARCPLLDAVWDLEEGSGAGPRDSSFLGALSRGGTRISCTFIKSSPGPTPSPALAAVWGAEREPPRTLGEVRGARGAAVGGKEVDILSGRWCVLGHCLRPARHTGHSV